MSERFILAGVGSVQLFRQDTGELIVTSKTLTDSGINFTLTAEDIRGGMANKLLGQYFHDSGMGLTLTDSLFSMQYLALNVGGELKGGADVLITEPRTVTTAEQVDTTHTPRPFGNFGTIGWYTIVGKEQWIKITFDADGIARNVRGLKVGDKICVKYMKEDASAEQFTVSSAFIPTQCYALLTLPLFKAGTEATTYASSSKVGEVQVEIPNFILAGAQDISLTASGASTTALSGNALATFSDAEGCDGDGYYAKLKQITYNKDEFADVKTIVIADSDIDLTVDDKQTIQVYAIYGGIKAPKLIDNSKITFTTSQDSIATVGSHNGEVTAISVGEAIIEAVITDPNHSDLVAKAVVTVTAKA